MKLDVDMLLIQEIFIIMRLNRQYKVGTPIRFKWYYNGDRYRNPNPQFIVKEGVVANHDILYNVIIHVPESDTYFGVLTEDII